jgi:RsiW-degrading membrane proteinase PrsW (M82 family)
MSFLFFIIFGLLPSITWLLYYLQKDVHPEPKRMVLKVFLWGMLITLPAYFTEEGIKALNLPHIFYIFLGIAGTEEILKYLVVKFRVLNNPEFDEPLDLTLYMIIAGLGFAGLENILYLLKSPTLLLVVIISFLRFLGATFLHTLCSGIFGYFLALSFFKPKKKLNFFAIGLLIAVGAHGLFDLSFEGVFNSLEVITQGITQESTIKIIKPDLLVSSIFILFTILISLAIFVLQGFNKLKKMKSVCLIEKKS